MGLALSGMTQGPNFSIMNRMEAEFVWGCWFKRFWESGGFGDLWFWCDGSVWGGGGLVWLCLAGSVGISYGRLLGG